jgi:hypothetical protein
MAIVSLSRHASRGIDLATRQTQHIVITACMQTSMDTKIERVASRQVDRWKEQRVYSNCVEQRARVKHVLPMKMMRGDIYGGIARYGGVRSIDLTSEPTREKTADDPSLDPSLTPRHYLRDACLSTRLQRTIVQPHVRDRCLRSRQALL